VKNANDCRVAPLQHAHDAAHAASIGFGWLNLDQHLIALHGAVDLVRRNENIVVANCLLCVWPDKAVAIAMQVEASSGEIIARASCAEWSGNAPVLAVEFGQRAAHSEAGELFEEQTPLPSAAQRQFAHQLLVSGLPAGRARNPRQQFLVGHSSRVGYSRVFCVVSKQVGAGKTKASPILQLCVGARIHMPRKNSCEA
jgi:hypothetical protein